MSAGGTTLKKGDTLTIDGSTGQVLVGRWRCASPELTGEFGTLMKWADAVRKLKVRQCRDAGRRAPPSGSAPRARALPHRAHVLRREPHPRRA
jgi:hypothetical protein